MSYIPLMIFAYLLGSVPFGLLIARSQGVDLRQVGSGNIGATNAARVLGKKWGSLCFLLDVLKGLIPMLMVPMLGIAENNTGPLSLTLWLFVGCAAVLGHVFPLYLKFKGGKGVATSLGIVLGLWPYYTLCGLGAFAVWLIIVYVWRYVSLASIIAAVSFPVFFIIAILILEDWQLSQLWPLLLIAVLMCLLVILRHHENIRRLAAGSESKVFQKVVSTDQ